MAAAASTRFSASLGWVLFESSAVITTRLCHDANASNTDRATGEVSELFCLFRAPAFSIAKTDPLADFLDPLQLTDSVVSHSADQNGVKQMHGFQVSDRTPTQHQNEVYFKS